MSNSTSEARACGNNLRKLGNPREPAILAEMASTGGIGGSDGSSDGV